MAPGPDRIRLGRRAAAWLLCAGALSAQEDRDRFRAGDAFTLGDPALLQAPDSVAAADFGYVPASAVPRVDALLYPIPLQEEGNLWSQWGDGLIASDGRFWSAIGDHGGPGGRSYVYAYDADHRRLELVFDQQKLLGQREGDWGFGKIHCRLEELEDGRICWGTYWGNAPPEDWEQENELYGMVVAADPVSRRLDVLGVLKRPYVIPAAMADTRRGLFYALPCDRRWQGQGFAVFDLRQGRTVYYGHVDTEASRRFVLVDETGGGAWFSVRPDSSRQVWLARYDAATNTVEERALPLPAGYGPMRAGTEKRDGLGLFYGICDGLVVRIDPDGRRAEPLGAIWPERPGVQEEDPAEHKIHTEYFEIDAGTAAALNNARLEGRRIIAVGTTSVRVLEQIGRKLSEAGGGEVGPTRGQADLFILPGHEFTLVDAMITNFHLPRSTLLMLVSAFAGRERVLRAYREAITERYRFYSFGDAMLIA